MGPRGQAAPHLNRPLLRVLLNSVESRLRHEGFIVAGNPLGTQSPRRSVDLGLPSTALEALTSQRCSMGSVDAWQVASASTEATGDTSPAGNAAFSCPVGRLGLLLGSLGDTCYS